ncbi:SpaA isopeptide-forming pilin-related protein [Lentzea sp. NPDC004782]|uniref:MSCRAMM family protein n=1 Tax=Lentzea sp. NPDC004782 TaxID=3154458 RepID=UPI0033BD5A83
MRRRLMIAGAAVSAFVLGLLGPAGVAVAGPVGTAAGFEDDDANLAPQAPVNFDWNSFSPTTWTGTAGTRTANKTVSGWAFTGLEDRQATTTDSGFAGGTKQDDICPSVITAKASNKDDLKRVYVASKTVGSDVFLTLAWVRIPQNTTSPSAHVAFEFNKGVTSCGTGSGGLVQRTAGDMLIVYDFEGGGTPALKLSRWITSGACEVGSDTAPCWGVATTLSSGVAEAAVNTGSTAQDTVAPATETLGLHEFGEAGINLTAAGVFAPGVCEGFGKAYAVSRSSGQSSTAQMKDLVGPGNVNIRNCGSVAVTKLGSDGGSQAGAVFTLYNGTGTGGTVVGTCTVQANGSCDPTFQNLPVGTYTLDETTVPAGYDKPANLPDTFSIAAGENKTVTYTDPARPATVNVQKKDDAGAAVPGAVFTLYQGTTTIGSCTTDAAGVCQPPFANLPAGTYTIDETTTPTGYVKDATLPYTFTVTRGETKNLSFTNPRTFKVIVLVCREADSKLYPSGVTIDGQAAGNSLSSAQASTAGLSEAALCGITTGQRGGLQTGNHSANPVAIN